MDSYTITIRPNDESGNSTTLVVDTSGDEVRITDVHLHAAGGLTGGEMPSVDFGFLLRAVAGPAPSLAAVASPPPAPTQADAPASGVDESAVTAPPVAATGAPQNVDATPVPAPGPARRRSSSRLTTAARGVESSAAAAGGQPAGGKPATAPAKATASAKAAAPTKATAPRKARAPRKTGNTETAAATERVYRRMPADFADVYRQAGAAAAIGDHYGVPRHTAQGWIRRFKATDAASES